MPGQLLIMCWHNVEHTWCFPADPERGERGFTRQLSFLRRAASVVDLGEACTALAGGLSLPPRAVALTFDDGYRDNLELAVPVLERLGLRATFFLSPALLSGAAPWWEELSWAFAHSARAQLRWDGHVLDLTEGKRHGTQDRTFEQLKRLDERSRRSAVAELSGLLLEDERGLPSGLLMDWDGAAELVRRGQSVQSHSMDHCILANESPAAQEVNLATSRAELETRLGITVDLLAYPNGTGSDFDAQTIVAAKATGYRNALTTIPGINTGATDPFALRRLVMHSERGTSGFAGVAKDLLAVGVRRLIRR